MTTYSQRFQDRAKASHVKRLGIRKRMEESLVGVPLYPLEMLAKRALAVKKINFIWKRITNPFEQLTRLTSGLPATAAEGVVIPKAAANPNQHLTAADTVAMQKDYQGFPIDTEGAVNLDLIQGYEGR
ncbi:hypothetical protein NE237_004093 [Protea cynaroides]|uniref:Uncharacterized protein n=1 Tax=Protea cynaroides TaxID=273540 RepID=A0A9Q0QTC2_9MAGN|nr:hypothetical protein NE237_004093 [Protea cynaroides]